MALFKQETPEEIQARVDKHNGTVGWTEEQRAADAEATRRRLMSDEAAALEDIQSVTTKGDAMAAGQRCMARAKAAFIEGSNKQFYTRLDLSNLRYDVAQYWQTRALTYYQLATLLPEDNPS
jgi:hypothetical protein